MAQVVELFGAPGVGKSSLLRALDGRRAGGRRFIAAQRLLRVPRGGPLGLLLRRELTAAERRSALAAQRDDWADLLALVASAPLGRGDESDDPLRALHAPGWLATTLELRALADAAPDDFVVVLDEGLVQRAPLVVGPAASDRDLESYLRALPRPALHVHLVEEPSVLVRRLRARERTIDRHAGLDDVQLEGSVTADALLLERCAAILDREGGRVIRVTTTGDVRGTAEEVLGMLGSAG